MLGRNPHLYKYFNEANQRSKKQASAFASFISGGDSGGGCLKPKGTPGVHDNLSVACPSAQSKTLADGMCISNFYLMKSYNVFLVYYSYNVTLTHKYTN